MGGKKKEIKIFSLSCSEYELEFLYSGCSPFLLGVFRVIFPVEMLFACQSRLRLSGIMKILLVIVCAPGLRQSISFKAFHCFSAAES